MSIAQKQVQLFNFQLPIVPAHETCSVNDNSEFRSYYESYNLSYLNYINVEYQAKLVDYLPRDSNLFNKLTLFKSRLIYDAMKNSSLSNDLITICYQQLYLPKKRYAQIPLESDFELAVRAIYGQFSEIAGKFFF